MRMAHLEFSTTSTGAAPAGFVICKNLIKRCKGKITTKEIKAICGFGDAENHAVFGVVTYLKTKFRTVDVLKKTTECGVGEYYFDLSEIRTVTLLCRNKDVLERVYA